MSTRNIVLHDAGKADQLNNRTEAAGAHSADEVKPLQNGVKVDKPIWSYPRNDAGMADAFAQRNSDFLRYAPGIGWLVWTGCRWERDVAGAVTQRAILLSRAARYEAADLENEGKDAATRYALRMGDRARITAALELAKSHQALLVRPDQLDANPRLLGCRNGVIDLQTGQFRKANRDDLITLTLGTRWEDGAECPIWERFICDVTKGDSELSKFLCRALGYTLSGLTSEQIFYFLHGVGANGKSVFCLILESLMGEYAHRASPELFEKCHTRNKAPELAELPGKRLIITSETHEGGRLDERLIKDLSGGETLRGEAKFKEGFSFKPQAKIWISGNYKPAITGTDLGIWRRVRLVPFEARFQGPLCDPKMGEKLMEELPGILRWAVAGFQDWNLTGMGMPETVRLAGAEYREDEDTLGQFITECIEDSDCSTVAKGDVFSAYESWAQGQGIRHTLTAGQLTRHLKGRGWKEHHKAWRGKKIVGA